MPPAWSTVLEIAGVGSLQLFGYLAGLICLMYGLTSPLFHDRPARELSTVSDDAATTAKAPDDHAAETERRRRAVGLAVAVACASTSRPPTRAEGSSAWRRLQHARRITQPTSRQRARS